MERILVVENEWTCALTLKNEFVSEGYAVTVVGDGESAISHAMSGGFDLMVLDLGLPKKDGKAVCHELRQSQNTIPILMLTGEWTEASDKAHGLDLGADDYVVKPWDTEELLARVRALLRRGVGGTPDIYRFGATEVNLARAEVRRDDKSIQLTKLEFKLLSILVRRANRVQRRDRLYIEIGANSPDSVDNHIMNLRRKIEPVPEQPMFIVTLPGIGYVFKPPQKSDDILT